MHPVHQVPPLLVGCMKGVVGMSVTKEGGVKKERWGVAAGAASMLL